ncbi:MAG: hypothetical protein ABIE74_01005 [Pseudomonadota bacterium]
MAKRASYDLSQFVIACNIGNKSALVLDEAMKTAKLDFNLYTQDKVLSFIGNGGLESPKFANTERWIKNPDPKNPIMVDSYNFFSGLDYGYLAFLFQLKFKKWFIKSFKKNDKPDPRNLPFAEPLRAIFGGKK